MSIFYESILDNLNRNIKNQELYKEQIDSLPKGRIVVRKRKESGYCYLEFRQDSKVNNLYLGAPDSNRVEEVKKQIEEREIYRQRLASLLAEEKEMRKALKAIEFSSGQ